MPFNARDEITEASDIIIKNYTYLWQYFSQFRFALTVTQRALLRKVEKIEPSLEIGINDGSSAAVVNFGKEKYTYGGDMPEDNTFESMGLHVDPDLNVYNDFIGLDAHALPFADNTFNTIVTNDMMSYGVDRHTILNEICRVLAPGGTAFISETTHNIHKYPEMLRELQKVVPTVATLPDIVGFYQRELKARGMIEIESRTYFDARLASLTLAALYRGEHFNPVTDDNRASYEEGLRSLAAYLADELEAPDDGEGWQVYAICKKPGTLETLPKPRPVCFQCGSSLNVDLLQVICPKCGANYRSEMGKPYVLKNYEALYSPKQNVPRARTRNEKITSLILQFKENFQHLKGEGNKISVLNYDKSTIFLIDMLSEDGFAFDAIYTGEERFCGRSTRGIAIRPLSDLPSTASWAVISPLSDRTVLDDLDQSGFTGIVIVSNEDWHRWEIVDFPRDAVPVANVSVINEEPLQSVASTDIARLIAKATAESAMEDYRDWLPWLVADSAGARSAEGIVGQAGKAGYLCSGPYWNLQQGAYRAQVTFVAKGIPDDRPVVVIEIANNLQWVNSIQISEDELRAGKATILFSIDAADKSSTVNSVEIRVNTNGAIDICLISVIVGPYMETVVEQAPLTEETPTSTPLTPWKKVLVNFCPPIALNVMRKAVGRGRVD